MGAKADKIARGGCKAISLSRTARAQVFSPRLFYTRLNPFEAPLLPLEIGTKRHISLIDRKDRSFIGYLIFLRELSVKIRGNKFTTYRLRNIITR